jgi:Ca2+-binding RTX toxin-like protein
VTGSDDFLFDEQGGDDSLFDAEGNDRVEGGLGDDELFGEEGDDRLFGGDGADDIEGEAGDDYLFAAGDGEADTAVGGAGNDTCVVDEQDSLCGCENAIIRQEPRR